MKNNELGAKLGWIGGGLGGILWIAILGLVFINNGDLWTGSVCMIFFLIGLFYIWRAAPWKHPDTALWKIYAGLLLIIYAAGGYILCRWLPQEPQLSWLDLLPFVSCLIPTLIPVFILNNKTWNSLLQT